MTHHLSPIPPLQPVPLTVPRDECPIIRRSGDLGALQKSFAHLQRILKTMPAQKQDPMIGLKRTRNQRGLV